MLDSPNWLAMTEKIAKLDPYVDLLDICICIPRLLERTDNLPTDATLQEIISKLLDDSSHLAKRASSWLARFEKDGPRYDEVAISSIPGFLQIYAERTFDPVFYFHTFGAGIIYMIYSTSMLTLQANTFKLLRQHRHLEPKQLYIWDRRLSAYADTICRSMPYNCRPNAGYAAKFGAMTPLVVARKYYEAKKAEKELIWCESVYQSLRVPELYSTPMHMEPLNGVQVSDRHL
jgi:hypothetical protein